MSGTWILPKQLHTSAYVQDTAALSLDCVESSEICERLLFVRSKHSPSAIWLRKWRRDTWTRHLFGRILKLSHTKHFTDAWIFSLADTHASHSQPQANDSAKTTRAIFGRISQGEFDFSSPDSASLKTSKDISAWGCPTSSKTWQEWVTERRGAYSARLKLAHRTSGSGCSSWPTSSARDWKGCYTTLQRKDGKMRGDLLPDAVNLQANWPSPVASEVRQGFQDRSRGMKGSQESLTTVVIKQHGPAVPASSSTDGSRPELSVDWRTPQANEAGAKVETLYTKDGHPAKPGQRAYRKTPDGRMVLQSQTINQQVEMVQNWATPRANKTEGYSSPEFRPTLHQQVTTWPTPASSGVTGGPTGLAGGAGNREKLASMLPEAEAKAMGCGKLNPRWVETLMGLPVGWTMPSCASPVTIEPMS